MPKELKIVIVGHYLMFTVVKIIIDVRQIILIFMFLSLRVRIRSGPLRYFKE